MTARIERSAHRPRASRLLPLVVSAGLVMTLAACATADPAPDGAPARSGSTPVVLPDAQVEPLLAEVPERTLAAAPLEHLAEGLVPPTNRWFSGLVLNEEPLPVFPQPLSFRLDAAGFTFGAPTVVAQPGLIAGAMTEHIVVENGSDRSEVTRYDEVSVTTTQLDADDAPIARVTIARGSPVVSYVAEAAHSLTVSEPLEAATDAGEGIHLATVGGLDYALIAPEAEVSADGLTVELPAGATANWLAVPADGDLAELAPYAASPLDRVEVEYAAGDESVSTGIRYVTEDGSPTLVGTLPHHGEQTATPLGSYTTVYGPMALAASGELDATTPTVAPTASLDLSGLSDDERAELAEVLMLDAGSLGTLPADTYFGGKALARIATLITIAGQLGEDGTEQSLRTRLAEELRTWFDPSGCEEREERCFLYDPVMRGMVGLAPSFGSEEFNDHHFHYGNFLYAAAVAVEGDAELLDELTPMATLLAADVASFGGERFADWRAFDPYSGHSWASGYSPFGDGNNQESSSEAIAAHHAVALWGAASGDEALAEQATWMLSLETLSASTYWTNVDTTAEPFAAYDRSVVGIVWDGKRDYATWFSPEPAAILGIQLIPMRPGTAASLGADPDRVLENIAEATESGPAPQFADYLLMYQALAGPEQAELALEAARDLPMASIDDGNTRTYMLAWIMSQG